MADRIAEAFIDVELRLGRLEAQLRRGEQKTKETTSRMGRAFGRVRDVVFNLRSALLGFGGALAAIGLGRVIQQTLDYADALDKTSDRLGVSTDLLQEYQFAAELAGVSSDQFNLALQRFLRRLGEARRGQGELKDTLDELNISFRNTREGTDIFEEFLGKLADTEDETRRLSLAFKGFDTEGVAVLQTVSDGVDEFNRLRQEARDLGLVLDADLIQASVEAKDQLTILSRVLRNQLLVTVAELSPTIIEIAESLIEFSTNTIQAAEAVGLLDRNLRLLEFEELSSEAFRASQDVEELGQKLAALEARAAPGGASIELQEQIVATREQLVQAGKELDNILREIDRRNRPQAAPAPIFVPDEETEDEAKARLDAEQELFVLRQQSLRLRGEEARAVGEQLAREIQTINASELSEKQKQALIEQTIELRELEIAKIEEAADTEKSRLEEIQDAVLDFGDTVVDTFGEMIIQGEEGFRRLGDAFLKEFVERALKGLLRLLAAQAGLGGGRGGFAAFAAGFLGLPSFANEAFVRRPTAAIVGDAPGGEFVLRPETLRAIAAPSIQIVTAQPPVVQRRDVGGRSVTQVIDAQMAEAFVSGGLADQVLQQKYGLSPVAQR